MDSQVTRQPIRSDSGMVVSHMTARVNFHSRPPGSGHVCDGCGAAITTHQTMTLRLDTADWSETRLHDECFHIWEQRGTAT